jgi:hypothetical protein
MSSTPPEEPTAPPPVPQLKPIEKIADELFMHDLARRVCREFGHPAGFELCAILLRTVAEKVALDAGERVVSGEVVADVVRGQLGIALGAMGVIGSYADGLSRALKVAKDPPVDGAKR